MGLAAVAATALPACGGGGGAASDAPASSAGPAAAANRPVLRVGFQKYGFESVMKARGTPGLDVDWSEFPSGPALTEAINAGAIDVGEVGEAPPVFAQAGGVPFKIVAASEAQPKAEAILVKGDSPIRSVADLKGKKVALNKGSNVHYLLIKALEANGLRLDDVQVQYLPPADARPAIDSGAVDAWVIRDPYMAIAQDATGARTLADGTGLVGNHSHFLASEKAVGEKREALAAFVGQLQDAAGWAVAHPEERAKLLAPLLNVAEAPLVEASKRSSEGLVPLDEALVARQQEVADAFSGLGLVPTEVDVADVFDLSFTQALRS